MVERNFVAVLVRVQFPFFPKKNLISLKGKIVNFEFKDKGSIPL